MAELKPFPKEQKVSRNEIEFLKKNIDKKYSSKKEHKQIIWNSDPKNYASLAEHISASINSYTSSGIKASFLRNFFFYQDNVTTVRTSNLDKLYWYLYMVDRETYFKDKGVPFIMGDSHFVHASKARVFQGIRKDIYENSEKYTLSKYGIENIIKLLKDSNNVVHLYIDWHFLKDLNGILLLIELFCNHYISLILEYNICFHLSDELGETGEHSLDTFEGKYTFVKDWGDSDREDMLKKIYDEDLARKITGKVFWVILENLVKFKGINDFDVQSLMRIESFLPALAQLREIKPKLLSHIYFDIKKDLERDGQQKNRDHEYSISESNYYCVVGYDALFSQRDKAEMLKYLTDFGNVLKEANVIRIFTIPSKRVKGKGWVSNYDDVKNQIMFQYIYLNVMSSAKTFCLFYDEDKLRNEKDILYYQDYVIKSRNIKKENVDQLVASLIAFDVSKLTEKFEGQKMYFAYPETYAGKNQCLEVTDDLNNFVFLRDFINRISIPENDPYNLLVEIKGNNLDYLLDKLDLNTVSDEVIKELKNEAKDYWDKPDNTEESIKTNYTNTLFDAISA